MWMDKRAIDEFTYVMPTVTDQVYVKKLTHFIFSILFVMELGLFVADCWVMSVPKHNYMVNDTIMFEFCKHLNQIYQSHEVNFIRCALSSCSDLLIFRIIDFVLLR